MSASEEIINAATEDEYQCTRLVELIECGLESIKLDLPLPRSIYRVPDSLRKLKEEAYTPQVISIGPFHYGLQKLQSMENYKLRCLDNFMKRANINCKDLVSTIKDLEQNVRECYAGTIGIESHDFMKMILVDSCFIIEFFLRSWSVNGITSDNSIELTPWLTASLQLDLMLLENQLPFFIIEKLYILTLDESSSRHPQSFTELAFHYFGSTELAFHYFGSDNVLKKSPNSNLHIMHFVDLLRHFYLPTNPQLLSKRSHEAVKEMPCAYQLAEAGLKFRSSRSGCLLDLRFNEGVLEIPTFILDNAVEICARNVMAMEQCHYPDEAYVTDYFIMLDFLIKSGKDVEILVREGIVVKGPGTNIKPTLPGNFCTGISYWNTNSEYNKLSRELVNFRRKHWYVILKSSLKQDYFRTPWMGAATVGAIILLILTFIQTVCTVIPIFK